MNDPNNSKLDAARRLAELRKGEAEPAEADAEDGLEFEEEGQEEKYQAFSTISADRQQKQMVVFRLLDGNQEALAYSYLVRAKFNPSDGIVLDFSGYTVTITGRNLRAGFNGLVAQRVAVVRQMDELQAEVAAKPGDA
jgi:hypothetical protein